MVALATDANYSKYLEVALFQLSKHSPWRDVCILVDGPAELGASLAARAREFDLIPHVVQVDQILNSHPDMVASNTVSRATYARLFLPEILGPEVERVLYLDLDVLILRSLSAICEFNLVLPLAAYGYSNHLSTQLFGHSDVTYFNAGVLLIDTKKWTEFDAFRKFEKVLSQRPNLKFQDQDLLNLVFESNWQPLPLNANMPEQVIRRKTNSWDYLEPLIVHFIGFEKPWLFKSGKYLKLWRAEANAAGVNFEASTKAKITAIIWSLVEKFGHTRMGEMAFRKFNTSQKTKVKAMLKK